MLCGRTFKMIIVKLAGGIGNQMFQYAAGRQLSLKLGVDLKLDISWFATQNLRAYALGSFDIIENFTFPEEVALLTAQKGKTLKRVLSRILRIPQNLTSTYIREKQFHFDPAISNLPDRVYLDGYWQSELYFADIEDVLHKEFVVKTLQEGKDSELAELMAPCESVSLHIRRGDYLSNSIANSVLGTCNLDYFYRSVEQLTLTVSNPHFFVFSDEPEWARDNLKLPHPTTFVDHNSPEKACEDLRLMSQCKHHIIANSSFSWWGAWLAKNKDKVVIAPKKWFNNPEIKTDDLLPDTWIRI